MLSVSLSCSYEFPSTATDTNSEFGNLDLSNVIVVGGGQASGFMDGAFYKDGQSNSFANILFKGLDGVNFEQFQISSENGFNKEESIGSSIKGRYELKFVDIDINTILQIPTEGDQVGYSENNTIKNDFSFPDFRIYDLNNPIQNVENAYISALEGVDRTKSIADLIIEQDPSLIIMAFGYDELLSYAKKGASGELEPELNDIVDGDAVRPEFFAEALTSFLNRVELETQAEVIIFDTPEVSNLPFFTEVEYFFNDVSISDFQLDNHYFDYNIDVQQFNPGQDRNNRRPLISFFTPAKQDGTQLVIIDEDLSVATRPDGSFIPKIRQATENDFILYPIKNQRFADNEFNPKRDIYSDLGALTPVPDEFTVTPEENLSINFLARQYNQVIQGVVSGNSRFYEFEFSTFLRDLANGSLADNGIIFTSTVSRKGAISSDGLYLNPQGNALLANQLITFFSENFGSDLVKVDATKFRSNFYFSEN